MPTLAVSFAEDEVSRLLALEPGASTARDEAEGVQGVVAVLLGAEESRRGGRDGLTSTKTVHGLRSGALLELPATTPLEPPLAELLRVHVVAIDVQGLSHVNDHHGFAPTDRALQRLAAAFLVWFADRTVVRMGGDSFAAIGADAPSLDRASLEAALLTALRGAGAERLEPCASRITIAELDLTLRRPHDRFVAGALVAAEIERALREQRVSERDEVQRRVIDLDG
jgi:GGDEF domain-containing protein